MAKKKDNLSPDPEIDYILKEFNPQIPADVQEALKQVFIKTM